MKINLNNVKSRILKEFDSPQDLKVKNFFISNKQAVIIYFAELCDEIRINEEIIRPIMHIDENIKELELVNKYLLSIEFTTETDIMTVKEKLLKGHCVLIVDGFSSVICCNVEKIVGRSIQESPTSVVIKGPREGFVESIKINLSLIRKRLPNENLRIDIQEIGNITKTMVSVIYLKGIASEQVIEKIKNKLKKIDIDGIIDSSYIAGFLKERKYSIFKQTGSTEKPDILCSKILEGRIGILVDGSPIAITLPFILLEDLQDSGDYYDQPIRATFLRFLRLIGVVIAILLPGIYISLQIYHYKILPTEFLITIMNTAKDIPFNPFFETVFIIILFEILYEANLRMPQYVGMALSIVGALILGDTAVNAGLVSPPAVMIVALSGISFYLVPNQTGQFTFLRLIFAIVGGILGLYGILLSLVFLVSYLCNINEFSSEYMAPLSPYIKNDQKDNLFKRTISEMRTRPVSIKNNKKNLVREDINE